MALEPARRAVMLPPAMRCSMLPCFVAWTICMAACIACGDDAATPRRRAPSNVSVESLDAGATVGGSGGASGVGGSGGGAIVNELGRCELALPFVHQTGRGYWLGGEGAHSLALSPSRALVALQRSFVGGSVKLNRTDAELVSSSVASVSCESGKLEVDYAWGGSGHQHEAFFDDDAEDGLELRPQQPWLTAGELLLTAPRVAAAAAGLVDQGTTLIRVQRPLAPISEWTLEYFELTRQRAGVGVGVADTEQHVFLFTAVDDGLVLTRIAKDRLLESSVSEGALETWCDDATWAIGLQLSRAQRLPLPAATGLTVRRHAASGRWLALFTNTSNSPGSAISVSSALALEGPWSTPTLIYAPPETNPLAIEYRPDLFCSGAAEHPAFNALFDRELLFTYSCSSSNLAKVIENTSVFVPRVARLGIPLAF